MICRNLGLHRQVAWLHNPAYILLCCLYVLRFAGMVHRLPRFVTFMSPVQSVAFIVQAVLLQVIFFKAWYSGHQLVLHRFVWHGLFLMNMFCSTVVLNIQFNWFAMFFTGCPYFHCSSFSSEVQVKPHCCFHYIIDSSGSIQLGRVCYAREGSLGSFCYSLSWLLVHSAERSWRTVRCISRLLLTWKRSSLWLLPACVSLKR